MLSRPPSDDKGEKDNWDLTLLPPHLFIRTVHEQLDSWEELTRMIAKSQREHLHSLESWREKYDLEEGPDGLQYKTDKIVVPPSDSLRRLILRRYHDAPTAGHPGRDRTEERITKTFWWPQMSSWIADYVKGCATCQQNKRLARPNQTPQYRITTGRLTLPFQTIAMDLITALPTSAGFDAILTIVDHGCTRAAVFLPCKTTITGEQVAQLYYEHVYQWFGLPSKMISDRDPRFTSNFARALCTRLGVQQNISSAFHPQTDGLSENKNQWVELFLRHLTSAQQDDWAQWLPIATATHNHYSNATTKVAPSEALLGYLPRLDFLSPPSMNDRVEERFEVAFKKRMQARTAINHLM